WTRVSSLAALAAGTADSLGPRPVLERAAIVALGLPIEATPATDWQRPLVVALLDPQKFGAPESGRSLIALVPVQNEARMRKALDLAAGQTSGTYRSRAGVVWTDLRGGTLVLAPEEALLAPARRLLEGIAARRGTGDLTLHVSLRNIFAAYGDRAERVFSQ